MHAVEHPASGVVPATTASITITTRPRGWEDLIAFMTGRGGPFGDPRQFKAMFGPGWGGPGHHRGGRGGRGRAPGAATSARRSCSCSPSRPRTATS